MNSLSAVLRRAVGTALLLGAAATLSAQLPKDSQVWKDRCNLMTASAAAIQSGAGPAELVASTRNVPAQSFLVLAVNRGQDGDHYVACTMYYMAAMAEHAGNGGTRPDPLLTTNFSVIAGSELRLAHHQHLNMHQHVVRVKMKVKEMTGKPLDLAPDQTTAVLDAAGTAPISLAPNGGMPAKQAEAQHSR